LIDIGFARRRGRGPGILPTKLTIDWLLAWHRHARRRRLVWRLARPRRGVDRRVNRPRSGQLGS